VSDGDDRDLYSGLIRLHILHHACDEPIFGLGMIEELARHGYRISPGTLYPILYGLEKKGYLKSTEEPAGRSRRKVYRATRRGKLALQAAKKKIRELFSRGGQVARQGPKRICSAVKPCRTLPKKTRVPHFRFAAKWPVGPKVA
jgi:PadR family transcriptional regulator PadR